MNNKFSIVTPEINGVRTGRFPLTRDMVKDLDTVSDHVSLLGFYHEATKFFIQRLKQNLQRLKAGRPTFDRMLADKRGHVPPDFGTLRLYDKDYLVSEYIDAHLINSESYLDNVTVRIAMQHHPDVLLDRRRRVKDLLRRGKITAVVREVEL